jgi:ubiquinol-cytochrome c reductase cytochrome c1 subunit
MRNVIIAIFFVLIPISTWAAGHGGPELLDAEIDLRDQASLQRGAKYFFNYCSGCHSLQYMRYNRVANDIGITEMDLRNNLLFGDAKPGDLITNSLRPEDGEEWFGTQIPDLTLLTRWREPDWVYTYLKSFYLDDKRPYGVNNLVFPDVGMPHALASLQGLQKPIIETGHNGEGHIVGVELVKPGLLTTEEYDAMARDLTNFLTYIGEPIKLQRQELGLKVLLFLGILFVLTFYLKKEYWRDIH